MRPRESLRQYLNGLIQREEMRTQLAEDGSREAIEVRGMLDVEESSRRILLNFGPQTDAKEYLVEQVASVNSWIRPTDEQVSKKFVVSWHASLTPELDVVGHEKIVKKRKKKKGASRKHHKSPREN